MMNEHRFKNLIENFSPELLIETFQKSHDFFRVKNDLIISNKNDQFVDIVQLGDFELEDNTNILVVSAKVIYPLSERSGRKNQYDVAKRILKENPRYNAGIFIYYDNKGDFRMSLIYAEYLGTKVDYSTFRRFTYFVSSSLENVTFIQQVSPFNFTKLKELKDLFSVEKVTREFFKKYHDLFLDTLEDFEKNEEFQNTVVKTGISTSSDFVKKMMGQIVFLYFVQKKGWLGVKPSENWGSGDQSFLRTLFTACKKSDQNYFNNYLEPLFYEALAEKRGDDDFFEKLNCRVPFLNGGLFESIYDWENTDIVINNKVFEKLLNFFDQYNFTVNENTPSDQEISVDPEMLGKIFENLLEVKDRKDKGAFYTPREIVHYMCKESLIQHLVSENTAPEGRIRKLFEIKDTDLSVIVENEQKTKNIKELKEISEKIDLSLRNIKIVDPAVGSGAFLMGMLNEISSVRYFLNINFLHEKNEVKKELSLYDIKKETLENCIYAVDIESGAVEIAKLRFWLALIVEYESNDSDIAPPTLPNLDYKIMQGDSLLEEYEGVKLFDEKLLQQPLINAEIFNPVNQMISKLQSELLSFYTKNPQWMQKGIHNDKPKEAIELEIKLRNFLKQNKEIKENSTEQKDLFTNVAESKMIWDEIKSKHKLFFSESNREKKRDLRKQIDDLNWLLIESTLKEQKNYLAIEKLKELKKSNTKPFFLWHLYFADVFEEKGGFDIVIGNPPYVQIQKLSSKQIQKDYEAQDYETFTKRGDLYCLFYERGIQLLKENGSLIYITSNKWMRAGYGEKLREFFLKNNPILLADLGSKIFDSATVDTNILLVKKENNRQELQAVTVTNEWKKSGDLGKFINENTSLLKNINKDPWSIGSVSEYELKQKIEKIGKPLKNWDIKINYGIKTGYNKAFIINTHEKEKLCMESSKSIEILKPILRGRDIKKYGYEWNGLWMIVVKYKFSRELQNYGTILKHLSNFEKKLRERGQCNTSRNGAERIGAVGETGQHHWLELDNNPTDQYLDLFKKEKIIYQEIVRSPQFYLDTGKEFFCEASSFFMTGNNLKYIIGLLNSKPVSFFFKTFYSGGGLGESGYRYKKKFLELLPLPDCKTNLVLSSQVEKLVDQILTLKKQNKDANIKNLESQIDQLVYELYDLEDDEIKIIEDSSKK